MGGSLEFLEMVGGGGGWYPEKRLFLKWSFLTSLQTMAALLTGLSKVFDCLLHDFLIAKCHAYGIKEGCMNLLFSSL